MKPSYLEKFPKFCALKMIIFKLQATRYMTKKTAIFLKFISIIEY